MKSTKELINSKYSLNKYTLEENFNQACSDNTFKKIVERLDVPKEMLIKYTSLFQDAAREIKNCTKCKNIMECSNSVCGYVYYPFIEQGNINFSYVPCKYRQKLEHENAYQKNMTVLDMPKEILTASMKEIYTDDKERLETIKWLTTFIKKYGANEKCKGLYLTGNFGWGKTYLVAACLNELAKKNIKVAIIYYPEFLRELKERFSEDFASIFDTVKKTAIILIDDIGAETTTSWNRDEILGTILQYRMQEKLPTFFTSNLSLKELEIHLAGNDREGKMKARRIIERIKYLTDQITMIAENRRK